jgi:GMP synthase (glutamine-hydrolysing)
VRLLVLDAYARDGREALRSAGATEAGPLYQALLERLRPAVRVDVAHPADGALEGPTADELDAYAGVVWTGSSLTIHDTDDCRVSGQIALAREIRGRGVRSFGSCWAAQIATVSAGGRCAPIRSAASSGSPAASRSPPPAAPIPCFAASPIGSTG